LQLRRELVERGERARREWHLPPRCARLAELDDLAVGDGASHVHESGRAVDVAALERGPFLRP
jgi:hypothetical protein